MGFTGMRRLFTVELPLAVPVIAAGLRVAAVSNVSIVSVAVADRRSRSSASCLTDGYQPRLPDQIIVGIVGCVLLALVFDVVIRAGARRDHAVATRAR